MLYGTVFLFDVWFVIFLDPPEYHEEFTQYYKGEMDKLLMFHFMTCLRITVQLSRTSHLPLHVLVIINMLNCAPIIDMKTVTINKNIKSLV